MLLNKLIKDFSTQKKIKILGIAVNSKNVKPGHIFFAMVGNKINGEKFINDAITRCPCSRLFKKCKYRK